MFQNSCERLRDHNRVPNFIKVLKNEAASINQMVWIDKVQSKLSYQKMWVSRKIAVGNYLRVYLFFFSTVRWANMQPQGQ